MFKVLRRLLGKNQSQREHKTPAVQQAPTEIVVEGMPILVLTEYLEWHNGFPIPDWSAIESWLEAAADESTRNTAWTACERAWLLYFAAALGDGYRLAESENAMVLSFAEPRFVQNTLNFMERTLKRVSGVLNGLAEIPPYGKDILILFEDQDDYYRYKFYYYPDSGEFAHSSGVYLNAGCGHFVTMRESDLALLEPTIVHEMTHACLSHLSLPRWIDEGLAVNVEERLTRRGAPLRTPQEMHEKHRRFWGEAEIQEFWSGKLFYRPGDSNELSYDLARILVEQLARDWDQFRQFAQAADWRDGGASAAREFLGISLGAWVASMFEKENTKAFEPRETRKSKRRK
ncbi:MAG: hypothetical protein LBI35_03665 [Burkholderiales bacterium]|jgi:hypothetical protein|nr:hypothetical protein [Burkholderiales bacterium]